MSTRPRRGAALAVALFALLAIAAIARGLIVHATAAHRAAQRLTRQHQLESSIERTLGAIIGGWPLSRWQALSQGAAHTEVVWSGTAGAPVLDIWSTVRRLDATVFSLSADGALPLIDGPMQARRSLLVELRKDSAASAPAVTAGGAIALAGDTHVGRGDCPGDPVGTPDVLASPDAAVTRGGMPFDAGVKRDPDAGSARTYARPAGLDLASLMAAASVRLEDGAQATPAPQVLDGQCVAAPANWGAVSADDLLPHPCAPHRPVVVGEGDLRIDGGEGQGALIVAGRLTIVGPFDYVGLIVASGGIRILGGPVNIDGALFTGPASPVTVDGPAALRASSCALAAAAEATTRLVVVPLRGWSR